MTLVKSHTLAGVWIEALNMVGSYTIVYGHTLAGVWIEARTSWTA